MRFQQRIRGLGTHGRDTGGRGGSAASFLAGTSLVLL